MTLYFQILQELATKKCSNFVGTTCADLHPYICNDCYFVAIADIAMPTGRSIIKNNSEYQHELTELKITCHFHITYQAAETS